MVISSVVPQMLKFMAVTKGSNELDCLKPWEYLPCFPHLHASVPGGTHLDEQGKSGLQGAASGGIPAPRHVPYAVGGEIPLQGISLCVPASEG